MHNTRLHHNLLKDIQQISIHVKEHAVAIYIQESPTTYRSQPKHSIKNIDLLSKCVPQFWTGVINFPWLDNFLSIFVVIFKRVLYL